MPTDLVKPAPSVQGDLFPRNAVPQVVPQRTPYRRRLSGRAFLALGDASSAGDAHWPCGDDRLERFRATHGQSVVKRLLDAGYLTVVQYRGHAMIARTEAGRDRYVAACNGEDHEEDLTP